MATGSQQSPRDFSNHLLVFIRFKRELYDAFRNSVVKSKSIIKNYTGSFIGVAKEMSMVSNGNGPSSDNNFTVGVLYFEKAEKCELWKDSDNNMRQQDWLGGVDEIAVPLSYPLREGFVFQVLNLEVNDADDMHNRYLPALQAGVTQNKGKIIAQSPHSLKFKGIWEPRFVVVIQWVCEADICNFLQSGANPPTDLNQGQCAQFKVAYDL